MPTAQLPDELPGSSVGLQVNESSVGGTPSTAIVTLTETPFLVAVTTTPAFDPLVDAVAMKVTVVAPAGIVTIGGTVRIGSLVVSVAWAPPRGAGPLAVSVQTIEAPGGRTDWPHVNDANVRVAPTRASVVVTDEPFRDAVRTARPSWIYPAVDIVKVAALVPA